MLNRINQLGLTLAVFAFAGLGTAHAQDENPCGDDMDNPCMEDSSEGEWEDDSDAEPEGDAATDDGGGEAAMMSEEAAAAGHSMVTAKGKIKIRAALGVGLSKDFVGDPIALAPDVVYGAMDKLDVGLYHTNMGLTGFWTQFGGGLCLTGDLCFDEVYNGPTGILANYSIAEDQLSIAANGGLVFSSIAGDTMFMSLKAGARINYAIDDKMGLQIDPAIVLGLNERDFNGDGLLLPVSFMYAVDAKIHAGVQSGISGPLDGFGDGYVIPLTLAGMYQVDSKLGVGGAFGFLNIAGSDSSADIRGLTLFANYAL
tara:strand:+ start:154751 stop:155689 length:939 start_codon:yes stop_codon:yes gene_type:complete